MSSFIKNAEAQEYYFKIFEKEQKLKKIKLPFGKHNPECCNGLTLSSGLYLQCEKKTKGLCKKCSKGLYGNSSERGNLGWKAPNGKKPLTWIQYLKKKKLTKEDGLEILKLHGIEKIDEKEWDNGISKTPRRERENMLKILQEEIAEQREQEKKEIKQLKAQNAILKKNLKKEMDGHDTMCSMYVSSLEAQHGCSDHCDMTKVEKEVVEMLEMKLKKKEDKILKIKEIEKQEEMLKMKLKKNEEKQEEMLKNIDEKNITQRGGMKELELEDFNELEFEDFVEEWSGFNPYEHEGVTYHKDGNDLYHYPPCEDEPAKHFMEL